MSGRAFLSACLLLSATRASRVAVRITQLLDATPPQARDAWLSYTWARGGGLPVVVLPRGEDKRLICPALLEETLLADDNADTVRYRVTSNGLLSSELIDDTHSAEVSFEARAGGGCQMVWEVDFEARHRPKLWEAVTRSLVGQAAAGLASHVATPLLYTRRVQLSSPSAAAAMQAWLRFVWAEGGGLPLPPPIPLGQASDGSGRPRLIVPPFLKERVVSVDEASRVIHYTVDNPGLLTYQVHSHAGRVRFVEAGSGLVEMVWEVEVRPLRGWEGAVRLFTSAVVSTLSRNLATHLAEPGARVELAGPRGSGPSFGSVAKESWLGGVLDAHLSDRRDAWEQTRALVQPWTWGRSDGPGDSDGWESAPLPPLP